MKKIITLTLCILSLTSYSSVKIDLQDISLFEISKKNSNLEEIVSNFEVIKEKKNTLELYVSKFKINQFTKLAPKAILLKDEIHHAIDLHFQKNGKQGYRSFEEVEIALQDLATKFPSFVKLGVYGKSIKGKNLYYLKVSNNVMEDEVEPEVLVTAATHGDELITTEVLLRVIESTLKEREISTRFQKMIQDHALYFIPVVNPDGFTRRRRYTADGTDPNREYPSPDRPEKESVQCIKEEIKFFHSRNFLGTMDLHAHGKLIMYPWGYTKKSPVQTEEATFISLGKKMSQKNKYKVGQISKIIYVAPNSSADYYYWKTGSMSYGIELTTSKVPRGSRITRVVTEAKEMIYSFIEHF